MMAIIFGGIMLLWFWGSSHKSAFFARNFNAHIKKLEDLLLVTADSEDLTAPHKLRLADGDKPVSPVLFTSVLPAILHHSQAACEGIAEDCCVVSSMPAWQNSLQTITNTLSQPLHTMAGTHQLLIVPLSPFACSACNNLHTALSLHKQMCAWVQLSVKQTTSNFC